LSLVFGVVANASILLVAGDDDDWRAKYDLQLIVATVAGGIIASATLLALVTAAVLEFNLPSFLSFSFTEAFYYAILSAVLCFATSVFIVYTAYKLWHLSREERAEVQFAKGHRRLMRLTVLFVVYLLLGAAVFFHIEGWMYLDAVHWADVTVLTIGFGDFKPSTILGRALLIPYATGGIFILFLIVYCIPKLVFDRVGSMWEIYLRDQERIKKVRQREEQEHTKETVCHDQPLSGGSTEEKSPANYPGAAQATKALESRFDEEREARRRDFLLMHHILKKSTRKR
jgi:potassium channel subfamily K, other eukaryote